MESSFSESAEKRDKVSMIFNNVEIIKDLDHKIESSKKKKGSTKSAVIGLRVR